MNGWKTYLVGIASILLGALGAVPADWQGDDVAMGLGLAMTVLRAITTGPAVIGIQRTFAFVLPIALVAGSLGLSGCSAKQPTAAQCQALVIVASDPLLVAKCDNAPDPLKDEACISISVARTAAAICYSQVPPPAV